MVTVIADKEELSTPVYNGATAGSNDTERPFHYIKDYQEVDFHQSNSCKPLPEDLVNGETKKSSIQGTFFVQVDLIEPRNQVSNNNQQTEQTPENTSLLLTLTDGIITVQGVTNDPIYNLNSNTKTGCKLLLTGVILIEDGLLQLTRENTRFQYGSNNFPRPRSACRGRGGGSYRPSYEGRRGGGNSNNRYDKEDNGSNFLKGQPAKATLMNFFPPSKISSDSKPPVENENQKSKDRSETKRRNPESYHSTSKANNGLHNATNNSNHYYPANNYTDAITFQHDEMNDHLDPEDDPSHSNYRERRNPLPPRLQRAQDERTRRNTGRYYDESVPLTGNELNGNYRNGTTMHPSMSSSSSYARHGDPTSYIHNPSSATAQHPAALNAYPPHGNMIAGVNGSAQAHLAYFPANPGTVAYSLAGIPSPPFHNQSSSLGPSYPNDHLVFCYGPPYATPTYLPPPAARSFSGESKHYSNNNNNPSTVQSNSSVDGVETKPTNESPQEENNEAESKSQSSSSSNNGTSNPEQVLAEQQEEKRRDSNANPRPRWRIGDMCLARWREDRQFYIATITQIHPPTCTVLFCDYNNRDQVDFRDLKVLPREQQYYPFIPPIAAAASDLNALAASAYFPPRPHYYSPAIDGCLLMPEPPPYPFNPAGTLYMCSPTLASVSRANRYSSFQQMNRRNENGNNDATISSSSTPSKDSNDASIVDSSTVSIDESQQPNPPCSIADAPLQLVTNDDDRERNTSTESVSSSKSDEQQLTTEDERQENNAEPNVN